LKAVILAGGNGTRLFPLTKVTNKSLLPVYNKPMIYYPIQTLVDSGIDDILIVCGGNSVGEFLRILGNGEEFGLKGLHYRVQTEAKGIADALSLAEDWADFEDITVILADNIFSNPIPEEVKSFRTGARVFLTQVEHPQFYGVANLDANDKITSIVEKPKNPESNWIVTGLYMYDQTVWSMIEDLEPSARGELEITDINNFYLKAGKLEAQKLSGWWRDCGESFDGYIDANNKAKELWDERNRERAC